MVISNNKLQLSHYSYFKIEVGVLIDGVRVAYPTNQICLGVGLVLELHVPVLMQGLTVAFVVQHRHYFFIENCLATL